jgi:hypothetical protein
VINGRNSEEVARLAEDAGGFDPNLYGRLAYRSGRNRMGAFLYVGRNVLAREVAAPGLEEPQVLVWDDSLIRVGGDLSYYVDKINAYGVFLHGRNDNSIADAANPKGTGETLTFTGGFFQVAYMVQDEIFVSMRLNVVNRPPGRTSLPHRTFLSVFPGLAIEFQTHFRLVFELGFQNQDRGTLGAIRIEAAI